MNYTIYDINYNFAIFILSPINVHMCVYGLHIKAYILNQMTFLIRTVDSRLRRSFVEDCHIQIWQFHTWI